MPLECTIWCPACKTDRFELYREPTKRDPGENTGVYEHVLKELTELKDCKTCNCGCNLERKLEKVN